MPIFNVMVNWTQTIERSVEIEVTAKDEESAQERVEAKISKSQEKDSPANPFVKAFDWSEDSDDSSFEYDASEA